MTYETILLEKDKDDAIAILTLNRPDKLNAINTTVIHEIVNAVKVAYTYRDVVDTIEINPLRVLPAGHGVMLLDASVVPR